MEYHHRKMRQNWALLRVLVVVAVHNLVQVVEHNFEQMPQRVVDMLAGHNSMQVLVRYNHLMPQKNHACLLNQ